MPTPNPFIPSVMRTVAGKAVHVFHGRQPIIPTDKTGLGAANVATVPAIALRNPFQRYVPRSTGGKGG
jgi:hypothetical protein